ncbi:AAA domain family protein [Mycobacterium xenopi 4042]|uniref:AAA domain family protein n=1 Tax=Mycobacterium xenopi 4042 TaxID=1299334 RepID=X7YQ45_MYCXE|nr:AAA domain family protein [Mycobacterium xenopi 4042]
MHTLERAIFEVKRIIVGQDQLVERMLVGLLSKGHVLLEGVPGVAKTLAVETFARVVGGTFARIQFTPDLVPTDIIGTRIYRQGKEEFDTELGPVVVNFLLADEINRAPAKVQSALLEVMQERHVSIGGKTFPCPTRFWSWRPRTRSSTRASTRCRKRSVTVSCSRSTSATRHRKKSARSSTGWVSPRRHPSRCCRPVTCCGCRTSRPTTSSTTRWSTMWCAWSPPPATPSSWA